MAEMKGLKVMTTPTLLSNLKWREVYYNINRNGEGHLLRIPYFPNSEEIIALLRKVISDAEDLFAASVDLSLKHQNNDENVEFRNNLQFCHGICKLIVMIFNLLDFINKCFKYLRDYFAYERDNTPKKDEV